MRTMKNFVTVVVAIVVDAIVGVVVAASVAKLDWSLVGLAKQQSHSLSEASAIGADDEQAVLVVSMRVAVQYVAVESMAVAVVVAVVEAAAYVEALVGVANIAAEEMQEMAI